MKRPMDLFQLALVSPEVVAALMPLVAYTYAPNWADILLKPMSEGVGWGLAAAGIPLAMLAFNYKEGFDLLSLSGGKKVLIEWPGYPALKVRILASFAWCLVGAAACFVATWMVASNQRPQLAIVLLLGGLLAAATATATVGLARFRLRELLGE